MLDEPRKRDLANAYRQALQLHAPKADPAAGIALIERIAALRRTDGPAGNPFGRLVRGLANEIGGETQAALLASLRPLLVTAFAYAVPSDEALTTIVDTAAGGEILEIGAGGGYWARCLTDRGARVVAFDRTRPERQRRRGGSLVSHFDVWVGGPREAIAACPGARVLLLCWPPGLSNRVAFDQGAAPLYTPMGWQALQGFRGERVVFVGARTRSFGSPSFFQLLETKWEETTHLELPHLGGWRDALGVHHRRIIV